MKHTILVLFAIVLVALGLFFYNKNISLFEYTETVDAIFDSLNYEVIKYGVDSVEGNISVSTIHTEIESGEDSIVSKIADSHSSVRKVTVKPSLYLRSKDFEKNINYQSNGNIDGNSNSRKTTQLYPVKEGQKFYYTLRTYESSYLIIAFDKDERIVPTACVPGVNDKYLRSDYYVVPKDVSYLAFSYSTDYQTGDYAEVMEVSSEENNLRTAKGIKKSTISLPGKDFVGFPTSFVNDGVLYVIYKRSGSHGVVPGATTFPVYKYSIDNGLTWSEEKIITMPLSDSDGLFREYHPYIRRVNDDIFAIFNISISDAKNSLIRRAAFARLYVSGTEITVGDLQFLPNSLMSGGFAFCKNDRDAVEGASSLLCGGNISVIGNKMFIPIYTPLGGAVCEWDMSQPISVASFKQKVAINSNEENEFTEAAIIKVKSGWLMILRNERHKSPVYFSQDDFNTVSLIGEMPYEMNNPEFYLIDEECALFMARARDCGKHGYLAVFDGMGDKLCETFYEEEPLELSDCCSGSMELLGDELHVFYYASASGDNNGIKQAVIEKSLLGIH